MAWNEPGNQSNNQDPWGGKQRKGDQGPPDLDEVFRKLRGMFGGVLGGGEPSGNKSGGLSGLLLIGGALVLAWLATGFYKIEEAERGVILQFGQYKETTMSGLHWHLPAPIEEVIKVNVAEIREISHAATMLTQDENIIDVEFTVQYLVGDAKNYLFNVRNPDTTLKEATGSAIREATGSSRMDYVLTEGRTEIAGQIQNKIQAILNQYTTGLDVTQVNMQSAKPPEQVKDAFDDVIQAREDEERLKNEAEAYRNEVIPKARGAAARLREEAEAYRQEVVARAEGEAQRFSDLYVEYRRAPEVTRKRLYLETLEDVMSKGSKVLVDVEGGNNLLYLPLDKLMGNQLPSLDLQPASPPSTQAPVQEKPPVRQNDSRSRVDLRSREAR